MAAKTRVVFVNTGSPKSPETRSVRRYLRQFLSDPRVTGLPLLVRWLLVNLIILPFRPKKSARAYRKIWTTEGSPLVVGSKKIAKLVGEKLGEPFVTDVAMAYGSPSIPDALKKAAKSAADNVIVFPLFPQYAAATYGSIIDGFNKANNELWAPLPLTVMPPYSDHHEFAKLWANQIKREANDLHDRHLLISFHGIPVRHVDKTAATNGYGCERSRSCCVIDGPRRCYRRQCVSLAERIAAELGLDRADYTVAFQSRLGRAEWLSPSTEDAVEALVNKGEKRLVVACPSFPIDCLETLEEINIALRSTFRKAGGSSFQFVRCPGDTEAFAVFAANLLTSLAPRK